MSILSLAHNNIIEDFFNSAFLAKESLSKNSFGNMDIYEKDQILFVEVDLPGFNPESLSIDSQGNHVTFSGKRESFNKELESQTYYQEIQRGHFKRTIKIPFEFNSSEVKANFKDGVLIAEFPKLAKSPETKIQIEYINNS